MFDVDPPTVWMQHVFRLHSSDSSISICCCDVMKIQGRKLLWV